METGGRGIYNRRSRRGRDSAEALAAAGFRKSELSLRVDLFSGSCQLRWATYPLFRDRIAALRPKR